MKKRALPTTRASQAASMSSTLPVALIAGAAVLAALVMRHYSSMNATDARGKTVPKDVSRRTIAGASTDRLLQLACIMALSIPYVWCVRTQTEPTVRAQLTGWWQSMPTFTSGYWLERGFAVGALGLLIERLCYTWVHVRTRHFVLFCETPLGRWMCATPPDVVYYMFCINKWIQSFTFPVWYFYTLGDAWPSTIVAAMKATVREGTRLQWVCLVTSMVVGQGLNFAALRALGKPGIFYGHRLGLDVPWATGFPFSVVSHAQYTGMCIFVTCWNAFMATERHVAAGMFNLTAVQVFYYVGMALVEDYL